MDEEQLQQIRRLLALLDRYHLAELVAEEAGMTVTIRGPGVEVLRTRDPGVGSEALPVPVLEEDGPPPAALPESDGEELPSDQLHHLYSPMTGIFFRSASPEAR